jgi:peptidyl-tRNA hydrolase
MTSNKIIQYVVMRKDLIDSKWTSFSIGANISQACHAATAAIHRFHSLEFTQEFLQDMDNMTVCVLSVESEDELQILSSNLSVAGIAYHLWIEKPEMVATALATAPMPKGVVGGFFTHLKLLR